MNKKEILQKIKEESITGVFTGCCSLVIRGILKKCENIEVSSSTVEWDSVDGVSCMKLEDVLSYFEQRGDTKNYKRLKLYLECLDNYRYERDLRNQGYTFIGGVDEVGRGPLAGPVVCAAVILPLEEEKRILGIDDSKKLSKKKRELLAKQIEEVALAYSVSEVDEKTIDEINILQATRLGMKKAVEGLSVSPDFVLTDGNMTLDVSFPQKSIVKGDALVCSIGAASILAKVYRDRLMEEYAKVYPEYGFERNVGYGTAEHIKAIREYGICSIHRKTFVKNFWDGREKNSP